MPKLGPNAKRKRAQADALVHSREVYSAPTMDEPLAYLLTWRTFGSWLHGDDRGSVDWQHNAVDSPLLPPDVRRVRRAAERMRSAAVVLSEVARAIVADIVRRHCVVRGWELMELAVRTNHVHLVVGYAGLRPEPMLSQFKAYATRALRDAGFVTGRTAVWAEHGSTGYLWNEKQLAAAVAYVREGQDVPR